MTLIISMAVMMFFVIIFAEFRVNKLRKLMQAVTQVAVNREVELVKKFNDSNYDNQFLVNEILKHQSEDEINANYTIYCARTPKKYEKKEAKKN